jgi:esterase/lipase
MKWIKKMIYGILIFFSLGFMFFYAFQEKLLFLPGEALPKDYTFDFSEPFKEISLNTEDNETLNAIHFTLENPKGIVLFFHGNRGNLQRWGNLVTYLLDYNYEVFVVDYRHYGKSTGNFNEEKMYKDALRSYQYLKTSYDENQIVVYGRSLGSTFAARVGATFQPKHVVLEAPFYNMKKATKFYFPLTPSFLLKYNFRTNKDLPKIKSPLTIFHGTEDSTTSFEDSKKLFSLANSSDQEFVPIPNATHHDVEDFEIYKEKLKNILN